MDDWPRMPPHRILLASDLSSRGDRALDRAAQLAQQWGAELLILHAIEGEGLASPEHQGCRRGVGLPTPSRWSNNRSAKTCAGNAR